MFKTGLCSVTFRELSVEEIITLSKKAGMEAIEWGGDVHVPPEPKYAKKVANLSKIAGLEIVSYGSYYRLGGCESKKFDKILETAVQLGARGIRVWAGNQGSDVADNRYRNQVARDANRIAEMAEEKGISIHMEYHGNTLTDTPQSTISLMKEIDHSNVYSYWQPAVNASVDDRIDSIKKINNWLSHVHVFHWDGIERLPLKQGVHEWQSYLKQLVITGKTRYLFLEFVKEDKAEQFLRDAATLKKIKEKYITVTTKENQKM